MAESKGAARTGNAPDSILDIIKLIGIIAALMGIFLLVLALLISQADSITALGESLGIPSYHEGSLNQPVQLPESLKVN